MTDDWQTTVPYWTDRDECPHCAEDRRLEAQHAGYCDTGECLQVEVTGDSVRLWESTLPGIHVVTTLASWQQWQDKARAEERARIARWMLVHSAGWTDEYDDIRAEVVLIADLIKRGEFDDVAAGDE